MKLDARFPTWRDRHERAGLPPAESERGLHVNDSAAVFDMAIAGGGVALGRTSLIGQDLAEGRLVRPFGPALECPLGYYGVCRPQHADAPTISAFRDWLLGEVARAPKCDVDEIALYRTAP